MPAFIFVVAITFAPIALAIKQSFYETRFLELGRYVGLRNYAELLTGPGLVFLGRSLVFVAGTVVFSMAVGLGFALLLNRNMSFRGLYRTILITPWVVSQLIAGMLWVWILNIRFGPVAYALAQIGIHIPALLGDPEYAMPAVIQVNTWRTYPLVMIFMLAGLQAIPGELTEAATIDGATSWQVLWQITLPLLRNTIAITIILVTMESFTLVTLILIMTGGGPAGATNVLAFEVFLDAFKFYRLGIASAGSVVIYGISLLFALVSIRALRTESA